MQETVVFIHGFGEDSRIWELIIPELQAGYRIITPDLPGSGSASANTDEVTMESMAEFIREMLDRENVDKCSMIGHSMGGYVTLAFAEKYPERLNRLGLFHSTAYADSDEKKEGRKKNMEFIQKHGSAKFLAQSVPNLFSPDTQTTRPDLIQNIIERYRNFPPDSLVDYTSAMMNRPDRIHVLKTFKKPVLFIMGESDTAVPLEQGLKQCSIPEFSYIYIATHSGHMGMLEEPVFCVKALKEFLSGR
jgi:pimeloyl-ACP methyl ester carboxylesterase